jgi:uncharacterized protein (DUF1778 family)
VRAVVPIRLSDVERGQIAAAAARLGLSLSGFVRQAALQASAAVERKAAVKAEEPLAVVVAESSGLVVVGELEERWHYVDGEPVRRLR